MTEIFLELELEKTLNISYYHRDHTCAWSLLVLPIMAYRTMVINEFIQLF